MKLIVFDLDGTLAELGKGITDENLALLKRLCGRYKVAVCSGKPVYYLCGFMRQAGIDAPVLLGENGATVMFGVDLPPKEYYRLPCDNLSLDNIAKIKALVEKRFDGSLWCQPNDVCYTPFPENEEQFRIIDKLLESNEDLLNGVDVYKHSDSYDFVPKGVNKATGVEYLCKLTGIEKNDVCAVGNGVNDYPMFDFAGYSVGINLPDTKKADVNFNALKPALEHLINLK